MSENISSRGRITGSYLISLMSITLVLFMLGVFSLLVMHARSLSNHIKENIGFSIIMNSGVKEANIMRLQKELDAMPSVKSTRYINKDEAIRQLSEDLGEDFLKWLGNEENPLLPSIDVRFKAAYANNDSLSVIESYLLENNDIKEVYYQKSLVHVINQNVRKIGVILIIMSALMLVVAIALIRNTIRLTIYSKRFLVRSMQLVGATESFIRKPFLRSVLWQGLIASLIAIALLATMMFAITDKLPELTLIQNRDAIYGIYGGILLFGIILCWLSTSTALSKYLNANLDKLYS